MQTLISNYKIKQVVNANDKSYSKHMVELENYYFQHYR